MIVAIKSCHRDRLRGCHQIIRETWGKDIQVRFFMGGETTDALLVDETTLDCPDDHEGLPHKTRAMCQWLKNKTDYAFFCDNDSFLVPRRLLACGYEKYDYSGKIDVLGKPGQPVKYTDCRGIVIPKCYPFASGGYGYFLSKKAMELVASQTPTTWAEDMFVAQVTGPEIEAGRMSGYNIPNFRNNMSWHFWKRPGAGYEPHNGWQQKLYEENK